LKVFVDMDGVIASFLDAASIAHNRPLPYDNPANYGVWDTEKLWGITPAEFWAPCNSEEFWLDIPKTSEADGIVEMLSRDFGADNLAILTAPNQAPGCVNAKRKWIQKYYPALAGRMIFTAAKGLVAGPGKLLIDDKDSNCEEFRAAGGFAILVPRLWNSRHATASNVLDELKSGLEMLS
jgi:5'(3')-deoxyribonucleotidase